MSVANEITRLQNAKNDLKLSINAKTDAQHQITNETIDEYANFVDSITGGGGSGLDWNAIGYQTAPTSIINGYNYAKQIYDNWDNTVSMMEKYYGDKDLIIFPLVSLGNSQTILSNCFRECSSLIEISPIDMSNVNNMNFCFYDCTALRYVPVFDLSSITAMSNTFTNCKNLSDSALDNILQSCITATLLSDRRKKLSEIGLNSVAYPATKIETLPHYQDFIDAGWTIGY